MEQQDWLIRQIEQIGIALAGLLARLLKLKYQAKAFDATEICNKTLKMELDFDLNEFVDLQSDKAIAYLQNKKFNNRVLNQFADILLFIGDELNAQEPLNSRCKIFYEKCLIILEHLNKTDMLFSFDRNNKIERIKNML